MSKLRLSIELFEDHKPSLETYIDSMMEFQQIVSAVNEADDGDLIIAGDIALRAGSIKYLYINEE